MEDKDNQTVTLLLRKERFKIDKKKLIDNSRYFAMLLSTNYSDHRLSEHMINYEIPLISFQVNYDFYPRLKTKFFS